MVTPKFVDEIATKLSELVAASPAKDIEKNVKALLGSAFTKFDLISREEFNAQREMQLQTRARLLALEQRLTQLEQSMAQPSTDDTRLD